MARGHRPHHAVDALEFDGVKAFFERWCAHDDPARAIHHEGVAVEHQFVLATEHVDVHHRQAEFLHAAPDDVLAIALLVDFVRRGVEHHEHFRAGRARHLRRLRLPDVLADQHADAEAPIVDYRRLAARLEVALLVKHLVVRQAALAMRRANLPPLR